MCFFLSLPVFAEAPDPYFEALQTIQKQPLDATPILPVTEEERKHFLALLQQSDLKEVDLSDGYGSRQVDFTLYKGDFSNEGITEYALITTQGSGHFNTVYIFKLEHGRLVNTHFDRITANLFLYTATPFAVRKANKTYLRYMVFPNKEQINAQGEYDRTKLKLCTFIWEEGKVTLAGPNLSFGPEGNLITVKEEDCRGRP